MCAGCGFPAIAGHWTEAGAGEGAAARLRLRLVRLSAINRMLAPYGLRAHDDGFGAGLQLFAQNGTWEIAKTLDELWPIAARLANRPIDPLGGSHG